MHQPLPSSLSDATRRAALVPLLYGLEFAYDKVQRQGSVAIPSKASFAGQVLSAVQSLCDDCLLSM